MRRLALPVLVLLAASCDITGGCRDVVETVYVGYDDSGTYVDGLNSFLAAHPGARCEPGGTKGHMAAYTCHACE